MGMVAIFSAVKRNADLWILIGKWYKRYFLLKTEQDGANENAKTPFAKRLGNVVETHSKR